jgi:hypothetical protein
MDTHPTSAAAPESAVCHHHHHDNIIATDSSCLSHGPFSSTAAPNRMIYIPSKKKQILQGIMCIACMAFCIWLIMFGGLVLLLHVTNTQEVHASCPGLWDFVLISILLPFIMPCLYLCTPALSLASLLFLSALGLLLSIHSSTIPTCVELLRVLTPPLPWLLFVACIKTVLYMAGALSTLLKLYHPNRSNY